MMMIRKILLLLLLLFTQTKAESNIGYAPIIRNDMNISAYDWNAIHTPLFNMRAIAMVGIDAARFYQDDESLAQVGDMNRYNRWDVRGVRLGAAGTLNFEQPWTYLVTGSYNGFMRDFNSSTDEYVTLLDAVLGIPLWGEYGRMQIGKMKEPISMERTMGMIFEQVMERSMHLDALLPSRNTGITFSDMLLDERMRWRVGIFNDWLSKDDVGFSDSDYQIIGRVTAVPYENSSELALLHLGAAYRYERVKEGSVRYDVGPEFYFSSPWLDTGEIIADTTHTLNAEVTYLKGPLWIASEYSATIVEHNGERRNHFYGYHIAANYFVTGEHRGYNKRRGAVRRITPVLDFTKGGWGALELSARYSYMDLEDRDIHGGKMDSVALGMVWHPRRDHQFHLQWSRAKLEQHTNTTEVNAGESKTDILQLRWVWVID